MTKIRAELTDAERTKLETAGQLIDEALSPPAEPEPEPEPSDRLNATAIYAARHARTAAKGA